MHCVKNSIEFVHTLGSIRVEPDDLMVSFDPAPLFILFIRLPRIDSLELPARIFGEDLIILFKHVLASRYFSWWTILRAD